MLTRLVSLVLLLLAVFQLAEFQVCTQSDSLVQWSHLGYIAITLLPPLGIHITHTIVGKKNTYIGYGAYALAAIFVGYFMFSATSLAGHACLGNYVIFQVDPGLTNYYAAYYYGLLLVGLFLSLDYAKDAQKRSQKLALYGFSVGYLTFMLPTTTVNLLETATRRGIPSIMCGFAILLAVILVLWVMPRAGAKRRP